MMDEEDEIDEREDLDDSGFEKEGKRLKFESVGPKFKN
jgi:hypothetical protein